MQGKEAAVAKALGSSHSPLIRKRSGGGGVKTEPCATVTRTQLPPQTDTRDHEISSATHNGTETNDCGSAGAASEEAGPTKITDSQTKEPEPDRAVTSLVADYSDSDSDAGL